MRRWDAETKTKHQNQRKTAENGGVRRRLSCESGEEEDEQEGERRIERGGGQEGSKGPTQPARRNLPPSGIKTRADRRRRTTAGPSGRRAYTKTIKAAPEKSGRDGKINNDIDSMEIHVCPPAPPLPPLSAVPFTYTTQALTYSSLSPAPPTLSSSSSSSSSSPFAFVPC